MHLDLQDHIIITLDIWNGSYSHVPWEEGEREVREGKKGRENK